MLGAVGVYGVTSHFVRRRQRDLGIVAALVLARLLSSFLYGVSAVDPLSLVGSTLALLAVGVLAALLPAWHASRLDPAAVFRES